MRLSDVITREQHRLIAFGHQELEEFPGLYESLYEYFLPEMPYGIAKARDGDPYDWIYERLVEEW